MAYTTIKKPSDYFNTKLYTGNGTAIGSGGNAITGVGFQPDFTWIKDRFDSNNYSHILTNSVSGAGKNLFSNLANVEETNTERLNSFDSDGFTVGSNVGVNTNSSSYVAWSWLGGGTASSNTDGSITSTVSANTTSGFSIVTWTVPSSGSATVGHGLGAVPKMIISKSRSNVTDWEVHHTSLANTQTIQLNTTSAVGTNNAYNDTDPTSSVFSVTASGFGADRTMVSYCFAEKQGFSKISSYTGNSSTDGTFVYTGFKPGWILLKSTDPLTNESWIILDTKRQPLNPNGKRLRPDTVSIEDDLTNNYIDLLSNGFKLRTTDNRLNGTGYQYIYYAIAEEPLVGDNPATAR